MTSKPTAAGAPLVAALLDVYFPALRFPLFRLCCSLAFLGVGAPLPACLFARHAFLGPIGSRPLSPPQHFAFFRPVPFGLVSFDPFPAGVECIASTRFALPLEYLRPCRYSCVYFLSLCWCPPHSCPEITPNACRVGGGGTWSAKTRRGTLWHFVGECGKPSACRSFLSIAGVVHAVFSAFLKPLGCVPLQCRVPYCFWFSASGTLDPFRGSVKIESQGTSVSYIVCL